MSNKNLKIDGDNAGRRIDNYLFNVYKALPKSKIYSMLRKGEVRVNSGRIKPTHKLKINDEIRIPPYLINFDNETPDIKNIERGTITEDYIKGEKKPLYTLSKKSKRTG